MNELPNDVSRCEGVWEENHPISDATHTYVCRKIATCRRAISTKERVPYLDPAVCIANQYEHHIPKTDQS